MNNKKKIYIGIIGIVLCVFVFIILNNNDYIFNEKESLDVFESLDIQYEGISPYLEVELHNNSSNDFIKNYVKYETNRNDNFMIGDKLIITAVYDEEKANEYNYTITSKTKEYDIKDFNYYAKSLNDVSKSDLDTIDNIIINNNIITNTYKDNLSYNILQSQSRTPEEYSYANAVAPLGSEYSKSSEPELVKTSFIRKFLNSDDNTTYTENRIVLIYKVSFDDTKLGNTDMYFYIGVDNYVSIVDGKDFEHYEQPQFLCVSLHQNVKLSLLESNSISMDSDSFEDTE